MKQKSILVGLFMLASSSLFAQVYRYNFNNSLAEQAAVGPTLTEVFDCGATPGGYSSQPIATTAGACGSGPRTVFNFTAGGGLSFDNAASLIGGSYTINILVKFDVIPGGPGGYQRILDFSDGASDDGLYTNGNCITIGYQENVPPYATIGTCNLASNTYTLLTLVRDAGTKVVTLYIDGISHTVFTDNADAYIPATPTTDITLFRDNLGGCEAGTGSIKYFSLSTTQDNLAAVQATLTSLCASTLPLRMVDFTANRQANNSVLLNWVTESEENTSHFELERSGLGGTFSKITNVATTNNNLTRSNYTYTDAQPTAGTNLYRLKIYDTDGKYRYSNVLKVTFGGKQSFEVYPNPAKDVITINGIKANEKVRLVNAEGRELMQKVSTGQSFTMDISKFPTGVYMVIYFDGEQTQKQRIVKQ